MSKKTVLDFLERCEKDKTFREQLMKAKDMNERKRILEKAGLTFTKKEFLEAYNEKYHKALSEKELEKIIAAGSLQRGFEVTSSVTDFEE